MADEGQSRVLSRLIEENQQLKLKVQELESKLKLGADTRIGKPAGESMAYGQMRKVLELRDRQLQEHAAKLEAQNQQLQAWVATLQMYQHIFESDPAVLIGISREMKIVLYNKAALGTFGENFRTCVGKPFKTVDFSPLDPAIPTVVEQALKTAQAQRQRVARGTKIIDTQVLPLKAGSETKGVLLKILISAAPQQEPA